jgi:glycosyltransferase involved in cell wall biosynthesis
MKLPLISVLLPTYNSEEVVRNALESISWVDDILVVDSYSTDQTVEICRRYGARIVQHEYINSARQKNWAVPQCRYGWVFQIDADEVLESGLREEIEAAISRAPSHIQAFRIPRKNYVLGRWMQYGGIYPDYQTRLFRRDLGRWTDREVHAHLVVPGKVETLYHHILHYGMPSLSKQIVNLDRYTGYEADEIRKHGNGFHWYQLLVRPWIVFSRHYVWLQGFREGWRGFIVCAYLAIYDFLAHAKVWEMETLRLERSPR